MTRDSNIIQKAELYVMFATGIKTRDCIHMHTCEFSEAFHKNRPQKYLYDIAFLLLQKFSQKVMVLQRS